MDALLHFLRRMRHTRPRPSWSALRYFMRWRSSRRPGRTSMDDRMPWLSFPAIDFLRRAARPGHRVFEFGGGGSTLFWADRVAEVVTVEHDAQWFAALQQAMQGARARWTALHVPADAGDLVPQPDPAEPAHFSSSDEPSRGKNYRRYAETILSYPDAHFDIILIDGRARPSCLALSVGKLKPGGLIAMHISNKNLELASVVAGVAEANGLIARVYDGGDAEDDAER
ncbi:MAG: hypothetical protein ACK4L7_09135, partial [Flavobacteriales bacterium]